MRRPVRAAVLVLTVLAAGLVAAPPASAAPPPPASMAAIGDSISQATDVCCGYGNHPGHAWSTGDQGGDGVDSHFERIVALNPGAAGNNHNRSVAGATMADAPGQAAEAVSRQASYVTILMGANDLCADSAAAMTAPATFRAQLVETMETLRGLPADGLVFVTSIPNLLQLYDLLKGNAAARLVWSLAGICQSMLDSGNTDADRQLVVDRERELNGILAEVCGQYANCRFDNLAVYNFQFTAGMVSTLDYFHPSISGQAALAEVTWRASWWGEQA